MIVGVMKEKTKLTPNGIKRYNNPHGRIFRQNQPHWPFNVS
jgi:hypothetical protein